uniref:Uncharacterized protein n=1 Tax=Rhizophora mucronata TaxID=61149 RepID=A0A2P2QL89_RHIMU
MQNSVSTKMHDPKDLIQVVSKFRLLEINVQLTHFLRVIHVEGQVSYKEQMEETKRKLSQESISFCKGNNFICLIP